MVLFWLTAVYCCDFNDKKIISGGGDGLIKIWDAHTGDNTYSLVGHTGEVVRVIASFYIVLRVSRSVMCWRILAQWEFGVNLIYYSAKKEKNSKRGESKEIQAKKETK